MVGATDQCDRDQVGRVPQRLGDQDLAAAGASGHDALASVSTSWLLRRVAQRGSATSSEPEQEPRSHHGGPACPEQLLCEPSCAPYRSLARFHRRLPPKRSGERFRLVLGHDGTRTVAFELPGGGATVSGRGSGLSIRVDQVLYQARKVKIAIPTTLTRICIQIASVVSYITK